MNNYNTNTSNASKNNTIDTVYTTKKSSTTYHNGNSATNKNFIEKNIHKTYVNKNNHPHEKSIIVAYLLWIFLFCVGAHRFYTKNTISGVIILALTIVYLITSYYSYINASKTILISLVIWFVIDAFLTYQNVIRYNENTDNI